LDHAVTPAKRLAAALDRIPELVGPRHVRPLPGGLSNHNYQVTMSHGRYVARLSTGGEVLTIDRAAECHNAAAAAAAGAGPRVIACDAEQALLVTQWLDGRTLESADLMDDAVLARVVAACRRLHAGPQFVGDFDVFAFQRRYLSFVRQRRISLPAGHREFVPVMSRIAAALAANPQPPVPCHNDLVAENLIDDGMRVWIIDYEYAANNDPCFELGNLWVQAGLPADRLTDIVARYYGSADPCLVARTRLYGVAASYSWALWAFLQHDVSDITFDFWSLGQRFYDRALADIEETELPQLLVEAQQGGN
jgi:thiamine kinase-like enzyme